MNEREGAPPPRQSALARPDGGAPPRVGVRARTWAGIRVGHPSRVSESGIRVPRIPPRRTTPTMRRTAPSRGSRTRAARAPHARALRAARCPERNPIIDSWRCYNTVICYNNQGDVIKLLKLLQLSGRCRVAAVRRRGRCAGSGRRGERRGRRPNERRGRAAISNNATAEGMPSLRELIGNLRDENTASISKRWEVKSGDGFMSLASGRVVLADVDSALLQILISVKF